MKFTITLTSVLCLLPVVFADQYKITYDQFYDNGDNSLNDTACSNGQNGLVTEGYTTLKSLPDFPYIGGAFAVQSWNSSNCGSCWQLTYNGTSVNVLAVDTAGVGFNIALEALNALTDGQGQADGFVFASAHEVPSADCGL